MDELTMAKVKGDIAYCFGEYPKDNPYPPASPEYVQWNKGYHTAMDEARNRIYSIGE